MLKELRMLKVKPLEFGVTIMEDIKSGRLSILTRLQRLRLRV
jgi:hypothetical protein